MKKIPSRIYIDITNKCPLQCLHCCSESGAASLNELTKLEVFECLEQAAGMGIRHVVFSGGEPMLRPELPDFIQCAAALGMYATLLTSGVMMTKLEADEYARHQVRVKMSVDGVNESTHDRLRGNGAHAKVLEAIRLCRQAGVADLAIHYTVHRYNVVEIPLLPEFMRRQGVRNAVVSMMKPAGRAALNKDLLIPPEMTPYVRQQILWLEKEKDIHLQRFSEKGWQGFGCAATCNKIGVTATGDLTSCAFFGTQMHFGNIRNMSLVDLWTNYLNHVDEIFQCNSICNSCERLASTGGGCRARALYYSGDINSPDPYCCAERERQRHIRQHAFLFEGVNGTWY